MNVRELIKALQTVENKDINVFAAVGESCLMVSSAEIYDDAVELWTLSAIRREIGPTTRAIITNQPLPDE